MRKSLPSEFSGSIVAVESAPAGRPNKPMTESSCTKARTLCILGMARSGTSALTRVLNLLGVDLGKHLVRKSRHNQKGFWENSRIYACHVDLLNTLGTYTNDPVPWPDGWEKGADVAPYRQRLVQLAQKEFRRRPFWGFKDPLTCRLLPLWNLVFQDLAVDARFVLTVRSPDEVARSLREFSGLSYNHSLLLWLWHNLGAEFHTRRRPRVIVTYDQLMGDWRTQAIRIGKTLKIDWPQSPDSVAGEVATFLDPKLRHHAGDGAKSAADAVRLRGADPQLARWAFHVRDVLAAAAEGRADVDESAIDGINVEIRQELPRLAAWHTERTLREKFLKSHVWALRLDGEIQRLKQENQQLRQQLAGRSPSPGDSPLHFAAARG